MTNLAMWTSSLHPAPGGSCDSKDRPRSFRLGLKLPRSSDGSLGSSDPNHARADVEISLHSLPSFTSSLSFFFFFFSCSFFCFPTRSH